MPLDWMSRGRRLDEGLSDAVPASRDGNTGMRQDHWKGKTIGNFMIGLSQGVGTLAEAVHMLPVSQRDLLLGIMPKHAALFTEALGLAPSEKSLSHVVDSKTPYRSHPDAEVLSIFGLATGYLATGYFYSGALEQFDVDFALLKSRLAENLHRHIDFVLPPRLDAILSAVWDILLKRQVLERLHAVGCNVDHSDIVDTAEEFMLIQLTTGSLVWQLANEIRNPVRSRDMTTACVFLSYSSRDKRKVRLFDRHLQNAGFDVWRDEHSIVPGSPLLDRVNDGITREADYVVVFLSQSSLASGWVANEIRMAYQREIDENRVVVIPVVIDECKVPAHLGVKLYVDSRVGVKRAADQVIDAIQRHVSALGGPRKVS